MMKKFLLTFALLLLFASCAEQTSMSNGNQSSYSAPYPYKIYETTYKGHEYIVFEGENSNKFRSGIASGVVHSPDCKKCKINK